MLQTETRRPASRQTVAQNISTKGDFILADSRRVVSTVPRLKSLGAQTVYEFEIFGLDAWFDWHRCPQVYPTAALTEKESGTGFEKPDCLGLWSPAQFGEDAYGVRHRTNRNVLAVSFLVFDIDETELCLLEIREILGGTRAAIVPSFNHSEQTPRFRIVLDVTRPMTAEEFERVMPWASALLTRYGIAPDEAAMDSARLFYDSAIPEHNQHLWFAEQTFGDPIDVDRVLMHAPPAKERIEYEAVPDAAWQNSVLGILFSDAGLIVRDKGDRAEVHCPFADQHTSGTRGAVLFPAGAGQTLGWVRCLHAHCTGRIATDFLKTFPQDAIDRATQKASHAN